MSYEHPPHDGQVASDAQPATWEGYWVNDTALTYTEHQQQQQLHAESALGLHFEYNAYAGAQQSTAVPDAAEFNRYVHVDRLALSDGQHASTFMAQNHAMYSQDYTQQSSLGFPQGDPIWYQARQCHQLDAPFVMASVDRSRLHSRQSSASSLVPADTDVKPFAQTAAGDKPLPVPVLPLPASMSVSGSSMPMQIQPFALAPADPEQGVSHTYQDYALHDRYGLLTYSHGSELNASEQHIVIKPPHAVTPLTTLSSLAALSVSPEARPTSPTNASAPGSDFAANLRSPTASGPTTETADDGSKPRRGRPRLERPRQSPSASPPRFHPYSQTATVAPAAIQQPPTQMAGYLVPQQDAAGGVFLALQPVRRAPERKVSMACHYCRKRKIACGAPPAGSESSTCNQCARRGLECAYPTENRRGQHKRMEKEMRLMRLMEEERKALADAQAQTMAESAPTGAAAAQHDATATAQGYGPILAVPPQVIPYAAHLGVHNAHHHTTAYYDIHSLVQPMPMYPHMHGQVMSTSGVGM